MNRTLPLIKRDVPGIMVNINEELLTSYSLLMPYSTFLVAHGKSGIILCEHLLKIARLAVSAAKTSLKLYMFYDI